MDPRVEKILAEATDIQRRYVHARLAYDNPAAAARFLGLHRTTPHKWENLPDLEEAVSILLLDAIEAARLGLQELAIEATRTLARALKGSGAPSVAAARAVFDRIGLPAQSQVDVTSGGEPLKVQFTWHDASTNPDAETTQPDAEANDHL